MKKQNLVFLHGFPFNGSSWDPQVQFFKDKVEVYAPDLRGHRNGPDGPGPWMIQHYVEDLKTFFDKNKISNAVVCGLSMGGYVALNFAHAYPNLIKGLVLCDTQAGADSNEAKDKRFATIQKIQRNGIGPFAQEFTKNVVSETTMFEKPEVLKQIASMIVGNKPENLMMVLGALASRPDCTPYLAEFDFPSLVMVGSDDKITPPELSKKLAEGIKSAKVHILDRAGHHSNLEQPDAFNGQLEKFLGSVFG